MKHSIAQQLCACSAEYALRVLRPAEGVDYHVRTLSLDYGGILTHWTAKRTYYCNPDGCPSSRHRGETQYKGYFACEVYDPDIKLWLATVMEMTSNAELDVRGRYQRGQVWLFSREPSTKNKHFPLRGELLEVLEPHQVSREFPIIPTIRTMYNDAELRLDAKNPMAPKIVVTKVSGPPPLVLTAVKSEEPLSAAQLEEEHRKAAAGGNRFMAEFLARKKKLAANGKAETQ